MPLKWKVDFSKDNEYAKVFMDSKSCFNFLIERFFVNLNKSLKSEEKSNDKLVENLIQGITKEVNITDAKLKKADKNNYLFYFIATEKDLKDSSTINKSKIWYRIKVLKNKIVIVSFIFELNSKIDLENQLYLKKLNQIIGSSEILV